MQSVCSARRSDQRQHSVPVNAPALVPSGPSWALVIGLGCLVASGLPSTDAFAQCAPAAGSNITVTCSGATVDQGPGINTGYGNSTQDGLTLNVQPGASVTGTSIGIDVNNNNNTINNFGTVTTNGSGGVGDVYGISGNGPLTVNNSGTIGKVDIPNFISDLAGINVFGAGLVVVNESTGLIQGATAIQGNGSATITNSGTISGLVGGGGLAINVAGGSVTVTNNLNGLITGDGGAIVADKATVTNSGTMSARDLAATRSALTRRPTSRTTRLASSRPTEPPSRPKPSPSSISEPFPEPGWAAAAFKAASLTLRIPDRSSAASGHRPLA